MPTIKGGEKIIIELGIQKKKLAFQLKLSNTKREGKSRCRARKAPRFPGLQARVS